MNTRIRFRSLVVICSTLLLALPVTLRAQANPQAAFDAANVQFDTGDYSAAAQAFEQFVKDYPTNALTFAARLRLAYASFLSQQLDKATTQIKLLVDKNTPAPPELKEAAQGLLPQVTAAMAAGKDSASPEHKKLLEQAVTEFGEFIKKYPNAADIDQAFYGRALASFQIDKPDDTISDLRTSLQKYPRSELVLDAQYLLALALSTKASIEIYNKPGSPSATPLFDEAEKILRELIAKKGELAISNEATFQLGVTLLNRAAGLSDKPDVQTKLYSDAMDSFHRVQPKETLLAVQKERLRLIQEAIKNARVAGNLQELNRQRKIHEREARKTGGIEARPDQKLGAILKIADIYYRLNDWNALRTLVNFLKPFVNDKEYETAASYYLALSYAAQTVKEKAVAAYDKFQAAHRGEAIAENLPLYMGRMFLDPKLNDPNEAIRYFQEAQDIYPNSSLKAAAAVEQARAFLMLKKYDEALAAYKKVLDAKPAKEIAASAQLGMGSVYESTNKFDEALAIYNKVRAENEGSPEAEASFFRTGSTLLAKGDAAGAEKVLKEFSTKHEKSVQAPAAYFLTAQAQATQGRADDAIATYAALAEKFPDDQFAPVSFFQRATILAGKDDKAGAVALLQTFLSKYPDHQYYYNASSYIADTEFQLGNTDKAIAAYENYVKARPKEPTAPDALLKITEFHKSKADTLGRYVALTPPEQATWKAAVDAAQASSERVLSEYTDSPQVSLALQRLLAVQTLRTEAELQKPEQTEAYFKGLATRFEANAVAKSKILLAYATYIAQTDPTKALELMTQAYDPSAVYSPDDLDRYGELLIENKDLDKAAQVYAKLGEDYPTPADGTPASAEAGKAQAASLFGLGTVAQMQNDSARAKDLFERLKREHPGSPKSLQADLGIARSLMTTADYDGGLALVAPIISVAQAPEKVRAEALYLGGQMHHMKGNSEMAINFFAMVYDYFPGEKDFAPDALWEGAQLVEQAAASEADPKKKADLIARARKAYETIVSEYPDSAFKAKAAERIAALPAK